MLAEEKFQAIFLDIDMPGQTGPETAAALRKRGRRAEIVYDTEGVAHESSDTLKVWEEHLTGKNFYRIHKSYLVAMAYVRRAEGSHREY